MDTQGAALQQGDADFAYAYAATLPLPSVSDARIVAAAVSVDAELRPELVRRRVYAEGPCLRIEVHARDARSLRTSVVSLYDFVRVSCGTLSLVPRC